MPWPDSFAGVSNALAEFNRWAASVTNVASCQYAQLYLPYFVQSMAFPPLLLAAKVAAQQFALHLQRRWPDGRAHTVVQSRFYGIAWFLAFAMYPGLCSSVFGFFTCTQIGDAWYLTADYEVVCFSGAWTAHLAVAVLAFLLYVLGIPVAALFVIHRYRDAIMNKGPNGGPHPDHQWAVARFGSLCEAYRRSFMYFEGVEMLRKMMLAATLQLMTPGSAAQLLLAALISAVHAAIIAWFKPYKVEFLNDVAFLASATLTLTILVGLCLSARLLETRRFLEANARYCRAVTVWLSDASQQPPTTPRRHCYGDPGPQRTAGLHRRRSIYGVGSVPMGPLAAR